MKARLVFLVFVMVPVITLADTTEWRRHTIASTGADVDVPVSIFTEDGGSSEGGPGRRFFTGGRRADLTLQSVQFPSPAEFLQKSDHLPGQYKRVTSRFFAVSIIRNGRT